MPYRDEYHPAVKKDLKQLDLPIVREAFEVHIEKILHDPAVGDSLSGDLEGIFSYHFRKNRVDYRIAYTVDKEQNVICVLKIGTRESFYEVLKKRLS